MEILNDIVSYILSFKAYVLLPGIILVFALVFHVRFGTAVRSALLIGIGFIGIFVIFDYFVSSIGPAVEALIGRTGLEYGILDVGWPPLAAISWSYRLAALLLVLTVVLNVVLLLLKVTDTVNIDIWNYWHFIIMGALVFETTGSILLSITAALLASVVSLKLADWSAPLVAEFAPEYRNISISTLSGLVYFPFGVLGDRLLDKVPGLRNLNADPESMKEKMGLIGEPIIIGFLMGILLGFGAGYDVKTLLELAFSISAVIYILPLMTGTLGKGLMPISDGMKEFLQKRFPSIGEKYIGLEVAILVGKPSVIVTGILLMPVALLLAFLIPGVGFIPLGGLPNIIGAIVMVVVACRGNIVRSFLIGIPIIAAKLLVATALAGLFTRLAASVDFSFQGYEGMITSFLDGGNVFRFWALELFQGRFWALLLLPLVGLLGYATWRIAGRKPVYSGEAE